MEWWLNWIFKASISELQILPLLGKGPIQNKLQLAMV